MEDRNEICLQDAKILIDSLRVTISDLRLLLNKRDYQVALAIDALADAKNAIHEFCISSSYVLNKENSCGEISITHVKECTEARERLDELVHLSSSSCKEPL
jgi:hypothetical protein